MTAVDRRLFGRDQESAELKRFLTQGRGALMLRGEAGVGKTALVDVLSAAAVDAGWRVHRACGVQFESAIPLAGLSQLVLPHRALVAELDFDAAAALAVALGRDTRLTGSPPSTLAMGTALLDLLTLAGRTHPVLIVLDDAHWLDDTSATVVSIAAQRLHEPRVRLVAVCRSDTSSVLDNAGWPRLDIGALDDVAAREMLRSLPLELPVSAEQAVLAQAVGNPLALEELPTQVRRAEGDVESDLIPLTDRLQSIFATRIGALDPHTRRELLCAALDGVGAGGMRVGGYVMRGVEAAAAQGLLVAGIDGEPSFRHPLVRSAVVQLATGNERRAIHAFLAQRSTDPIRKAAHLSAATVDPDQEVADQIAHAATLTIRRGAARTAVELLRRAAELSKRPARRAELMSEAAFVAGQAGRLDITVELAARQPDSASAAGRINSAMTAGYVELYLEGDIAAGHRRMMAALHDTDTLDDATLTRAVNVLLAISQYAGDVVSWTETDALVDQLAHRLDPVSLIYRDAWGDFAYRGGSVGSRLADQLSRLPELAPWDVMRLAVAGFYAGVLNDFRSELRELFDREQRDGVVTNAMTMLHMLFLDQLDTGQWELAEETGRHGLELTAQHRHHTYEQQFRAFLAVLAASRGETARARELAATVAAWARPRGLGLLLGYCQRALVLSALADGDYPAAYAAASEIAEPGVFPHYSHQALTTLMDLVEAAVHTDRIDDGRRHLAAALQLGLPEISPRLGLMCAGAAAMTATDSDAERLFGEATKHPAAETFPFEHARIRLAHGMWLRRQRRYRDAAPVLDAARSAFEQLGAPPWAERAGAELRAAGSPTKRLHGEELSAQERRIAELAAAGLSNKEIADRMYLSPRTVGAHLYRIFPKLGIARRSGLRKALDELSDGT